MRSGHPIHSALYDLMNRAEERAYRARLRDQVISRAHGYVVEVGMGTGLNLPYYRPPAVEALVAVEPDPYMRRRAEARAAERPFQITVIEGTAESIPLPSRVADTVVVTMVLCSVADPARAIGEFQRILKPSGQLLFLEHVRSDQPRRARLQDCLTPLWRRLMGNCHPNRPTLSLLREAGFSISDLQSLAAGLPWLHPIAPAARTAPCRTFSGYVRLKRYV